VETLAAAIGASGGMVLFSDEIARLGPEEVRVLQETLTLAREVDDAGRSGTARATALLAEPAPSGLEARSASSLLDLRLNWSAEPRAVAGGRYAADAKEQTLSSHGSLLSRRPARIALAVFCDFDGTFAVQDVGSTIAKRYAGERRPALWERLSRGELNAWQYNLELLDGLRLPEAELEAFLRTVELDPGAERLVAWCEERAVPFRILSDGFDRNLDRIQSLTGVRFAYDANRLWYEDGAWRIAACAPDPSCACGTGLCKRGRIEAFRTLPPEARVVHIGNGRVSDLCGGLAADVVFAKDSRAVELTARGEAFEPFTTLDDVVNGLDRLAEKLEL
jgi:2-hydroxy-3-keto-5-methylthiopentenyl-1-phosphate phosphatase